MTRMDGQARRQWTRDTPWRQGSVFGADAADALGLKHPADGEATTIVVVSHDCDLAIDNLDAEPNVEVIVGRRVDAVNGNFAWAKAPRTLHFTMQRNGTLVTVELIAASKGVIPKQLLAQFEPDPAFALDGKELGVLRSWLSARYNRSAFADAFVDRMKSTKFDARLAKALEPCGKTISFVYFDLDQGKVVERKEKDPYELSIVLVYPPGDDPEATEKAVDQLVEAVEKAAEDRLKDKTEIVFKRCLSISEDDLPISQARVLMQWRLEHMTHRADGHPGPPTA